MSTAIKVFDLCGEFCIDETDVHNLSEKMREFLKEGKSVELDFYHVDTVLTAFFNSLLGDLFEDFDYKTIKKLIQFSDKTPESIRDKFIRSLDNAKKYYESPKNVQDETKERVRKIFREEIDLDEPGQSSTHQSVRH